MPEKKRDDQRPDEGQEANEGRSVLVEDDASFIDEGPRAGKQLSNGGRKVADLDRVGAFSPDADASAEDSEAPTKRQ